jgi:AraC-like DNA-binding protein
MAESDNFMTKSDKNENLLQLLAPIPKRAHFRFTLASNRLVVPPQWRIEERVIKDFHLLFVCGGKGTYWVNRKEYPLKRGLVVFLTNGIPYAGEQDPQNPPEIIPIRFCRYDNSEAKIRPWQGSPFSVICQTSRTNYFEELFEGLRRCCLTLGEEDNDIASSYTSTLLYELHNEWKALRTDDHSIENRVRQVANWMAEHPLERKDLKSLASQAGLSPKYFSQHFKKHLKVSPKTYQVRQRLIHGRYLLENTKLNVGEVSEELGYPDPFVFSRQFKNHFKRPPKDYRHSTEL